MNPDDEQFDLLKSLGWGCPWPNTFLGWFDCRPITDAHTPVEETMNLLRLAGYQVHRTSGHSLRFYLFKHAYSDTYEPPIT